MDQRTSRTARADQLHAELRDARDCDALEPCESCRAKAREYRAVRRAAEMGDPPPVPAPRRPTELQRRIARA